ncbi:hypothetical protein BH10PAT3_BH10PAT3_8370 [soil metagenome]
MTKNRLSISFETENETIRARAFEAGRFILVYEAENGIFPDSIQIAAHVLGEEVVLNDRRLKRTGTVLGSLLGQALSNLEKDYLGTLEAFGCMEEVFEIMHTQDRALKQT